MVAGKSTRKPEKPDNEESFDTAFMDSIRQKSVDGRASAGRQGKTAAGTGATEKAEADTEEKAEARAEADARADAKAVADLIEELKANAELIAEEMEEELLEEEADPLAQAQAQADEMRDKYLRLQAEWENYRKRTNTEREQERRRAAENLVERLLPIVDDLERAIEHSDTANEDSLKGGIAAVYNKLNEVLTKEGVKVIDPVGEAFDAKVHQAVGKHDDPGLPDETVTQVYQKGYEMGGRVLRTAMVVVSAGGPKREEA